MLPEVAFVFVRLLICCKCLFVFAECQPGFFKAETSSGECKPCPDNTQGLDSGALFCPCIDGFYRAPTDPLTGPCSGEKYAENIDTSHFLLLHDFPSLYFWIPIRCANSFYSSEDFMRTWILLQAPENRHLGVHLKGIISVTSFRWLLGVQGAPCL